jgi:hypothetical protein
MTDSPRRDAADDGPHPVPHIRDAQDAGDHVALDKDPSNEEAIADITNDESFSASDPPSHATPNQREPAPSSGYDERYETALAERGLANRVTEEPQQHQTETEASGGKKLGVMRYVLAISLIAIVVVFAVMLLLNR